MLESLESETPNIKDLSIEPSEQPQTTEFIPDREIDSEVMTRLKEEVGYEKYRMISNKYSDSANYASKYLLTASSLLLAFPDQHQEIRSDEEAKKLAKSKISHAWNSSKKSMFREFFQLKNLYPETEFVGLNHPQTLTRFAIAEIKDIDPISRSDSCYSFMSKLTAIKAFNYDVNGKAEQIYQDHLPKLTEKFNALQDHFLAENQLITWQHALSFAYLTLYDQETAQNIFSDQFIKQAEIVCRNIKKQDIRDQEHELKILAMAAFLKLITTSKKIILEDGLIKFVERDKDQDFNQPTPPLPQQRSF